jgi:hypothetical protein
MIAQTSAANARDFRLGGRSFPARGLLICPQAGERIRSKLWVASGYLAYQFEKQRQRPWRAFMLQRTMLR